MPLRLPTRFKLPTRLKLLVVAALLLAISSCVQESQTARRQQAPAAPVEPTTSETEAGPEPTPETSITTTSLSPEGLVSEIAAVKVGDCFNDYRFENERTSLTEVIFTIVDCSRPHEGEVYHQVGYPDPEFPGATQLELWAQEECYKYFEDWVGQEYELSELEFSTFLPTKELWDEPGEQNTRLSCYLRSGNQDLLTGSRRNSGT